MCACVVVVFGVECVALVDVGGLVGCHDQLGENPRVFVYGESIWCVWRWTLFGSDDFCCLGGGDARLMSELMYVFVAFYDDVVGAIAFYEVFEVVYWYVGFLRDFDVIVVVKDDDGKVKILCYHDEFKCAGVEHGFVWGFAIGVVMVLFLGIGVISAFVVGGGVGAVIGAFICKFVSGIICDELKQFGEVLDSGDVGLVVVYGFDMVDWVAIGVIGAIVKVCVIMSISIDEIVDEIRVVVDV